MHIFLQQKMRWIYDNVPKAKELEREKRLCMGTIDSFLLYRLTGEFVTDATNASRTMLYNIKEGKWDKELLSIFGVKKNGLPKLLTQTVLLEKPHCLVAKLMLREFWEISKQHFLGNAVLKRVW